MGLSKADFCYQQGEAQLFRAAYKSVKHQDSEDLADPFPTVFPLWNRSSGIFEWVCQVKNIFHMWALRTEINFYFNFKKGLIIITTCSGGDSKEQNELQNSEMQWSCLLLYKLVQGYISYIILNHCIFPRVWSFLFILEPSKISIFVFGLFLWSKKALRSITCHTHTPPSKASWCTQLLSKTQKWNCVCAYTQLRIRALRSKPIKQKLLSPRTQIAFSSSVWNSTTL